MKKYWLMKSEPSVFSIDDLIAMPSQTYQWDGVRNYQARNIMRDDMTPGDLAFFYHSSCHPPGVVGIVEIVKKGYPDHTAFDTKSEYYDPQSHPTKPRWYMVDVQFKEKFTQQVTLAEIRKHPELFQMRLVQKGNRLSVMPVSVQEWNTILQLSKISMS